MNNYKTRLLFVVLILALAAFASINISEGKGGGRSSPPPPPSPPPCPIQSTGCYKAGDVKANFGELAPSEFAYFLPDNKCKSDGSCTCGGVSSDIAKETNPDDSSGACACIAGTDWNTRAKCCGDDDDDCGKISSGVLCNIDANAESANWIASSSFSGDIRYVGCIGKEYVSDGTTWINCDNVFWRKTIGSSEYMCIGKGRESIVECCGDSSCNSRVDGKRTTTGQSVIAKDGKTYYCGPDRKFTINLDVPNSQISNKALTTKNKAICEKAGFTWTGTKCCSEADDPNEYYNDPDGLGGCWNKEFIKSVNFLKSTGDSVASYNGEFHGCSITKELLSLVDTHAGGPLIINHNYCFTDPENNYYCAPQSEPKAIAKWTQTEGADKSHLSQVPPNTPGQASNCCTQTECWDGSKCIGSQKNNPLSQPLNGFRCIDGEWKQSGTKFTPDDSNSGYCPKETQCLANVFEKEGKQCIENNNYTSTGDNYCENGQWSSRTKLLALKLLSLKSGDYVLFCDDRSNALNNLQYLTESGQIVANVLTNLQTNNFCVLKSGGRIIAATSINKDIEGLPSSNLGILGIQSCSDALIDDGQFHPCDAVKKVWYNKKMKSFIYSETAINIPSDQNILGYFEGFIGTPIKNIIDSIKRLITSPPFDDSYLRSIKRFDRLYMAQQGTKSVGGSIEGKFFKNIVIQYIGFETDMCKFVGQFNQAKKDASSGISCKSEGSNYYVLVQGGDGSGIKPESIWPDLTAKLRLT